jgi:hypothetical protein
MAASLFGTGVTNLDKLNVQQDNDGTAALPSITFGDADTGLYATAVGEVLFAIAGSLLATVNSSGITLASGAFVGNVTGNITGTVNGANLKSVTVSITPAQIRALAATQIELVAAVTGSYLIYAGALLELDFGTVGHDDAAADGNLVIRYTNGAGQAVSFIEADGFVDAVADAAIWATPNDDVAGAANIPKAPVVSAALVLDNDGAEFTGTGDSPIDITIYYYEVVSQL